MDIEFHYSLTGFLAEKAGFAEAEAATIAYASQYVDDNTRGIEVRCPQTQAKYRNRITQTYEIFRPVSELLAIWPVFHFVPGGIEEPAANRKDGLRHVMQTIPGGRAVRSFLQAALASPEPSRLHQVGVASHALVDSWAHQNFVGVASEYNNLPCHMALNIGHLDAGTFPDEVGCEWTDNRLVVEHIRNNERYVAASQALYEAYSSRPDATAAKPPEPWAIVGAQVADVLAAPKDHRDKLFAGLGWLPPYRPEAWLHEAVCGDDFLAAAMRGCFKWIKPKEETDWYKFQQAAEAHRALAIDWLRTVRNQTQVEQLAGV